MQKNAYPFCGTIIHKEDLPNYQVSYRWHLTNPVHFNRRIKVTLESGHANHLRDDWNTTAYWYQALPGPPLEILLVEERIPRKPQFPPSNDVPEPDVTMLSAEKQALVKQRDERMEAFVKDHNEWLERRAHDSQERACNNVEICKDIRHRFLQGLK
ncbi:uncharacterized protein KD926_004625 [Aspergillus affinis]|uniref:uncharacterized protein n=1 Tax=Aspergillus affinis TaxID=1070780 RepID=UPI0022FE069D|nr:uncharacterized protein KD926_004625 [Aspergillus affinis]KAI9043122.1 hypothetical protein KD926_004625 [Aspergillus affinis]